MDRFDDTKQRVKDATDLVALLEGYLALRPRGRTLVALCPFHPEKSPSFTVYPDSQHYHCYGCAKSGDAFSFLMEREGYAFREAMEVLAERAGISLEGVFRSGREPDRRGPDVHQVLGEVRSFFQMQLQAAEGTAAREYLGARGLEAAIEPFALGYHPAAQGALRDFAVRRRLPRQVLEDAGLLKPNGYEPLAGRLIFAIEDERGRVVAFGGRILPGQEQSGDRKAPKYLNSPESPVFSKRRLLFGLHRVKQAGTRRIVVVEGYTDVIACHLAGFTGAVATLGTAFTRDHARVLERYATEGLVLLFDGDAAGEQAAQRALRELLETRLPVSIALLSDAPLDGAKDPGDALVPRQGEDETALETRRALFQALLDGAEDAVTVWFRLLRRRLDLSQAVHVEAAARECAAMLEHVESEIRRTALTNEMARHLAMPPQALARLLRGTKARRQPGPEGQPAESAAPDAQRSRPTPQQRADLELLIAVLADPILAEQAGSEEFELAGTGELLDLCRKGVLQGRTGRAGLISFLFTACSDRPELGRLLAVAADRAGAVQDSKAFWEAVLQGRRRLGAQRDVRRTRQLLQEAVARGEQDQVQALTRRLLEEKRAGSPRYAAPGATDATVPPTQTHS